MFAILSLSVYNKNDFNQFIQNFLVSKDPQHHYEIIIGIINSCMSENDVLNIINGKNVHIINGNSEVDVFNLSLKLCENFQYDYFIKCHTGINFLVRNWDSNYFINMSHFKQNICVLQIPSGANYFKRTPTAWNCFVNYVPIEGNKTDFLVMNKFMFSKLGYLNKDYKFPFLNYIYRGIKQNLIPRIGCFDIQRSEIFIKIKIPLQFILATEKEYISDNIDYYSMNQQTNVPEVIIKPAQPESYYFQRKKKLQHQNKKLTICTVVKGRNSEIPLLLEQWVRKNYAAYKNVEFLVIQEGGEIPDLSKLKACMAIIRYIIVDPIKYWNRNRLLNFAMKNCNSELFMYCPVDFRIRKRQFIKSLLNTFSGIDWSKTVVSIPVLESRKSIVNGILFEGNQKRGNAYIFNRNIFLGKGGYDISYDNGQEDASFTTKMNEFTEKRINLVDEQLIIYHNSHSDLYRHANLGKDILDTTSEVKVLHEFGNRKNLWELYNKTILIVDDISKPLPQDDNILIIGIGKQFSDKNIHTLILNEKLDTFNNDIRMVLYSGVKNVMKSISYTKTLEVDNHEIYPRNIIKELLRYIPNHVIIPVNYIDEEIKQIISLSGIKLTSY